VVLGTMHGARAALPHLRLSGGTLIDVSSIAGARALPLLAAYCAAKHRVFGFSDALRLELIDDAHVMVTTILPSAIDTPFFAHARSRLGMLPRPTPPVYEPAVVAEAIVWAAEHPTRQIVVGGGGKAIALMRRLSPGILDWLMTRGRVAEKVQESNKSDDGVDNLYAPMPATNAVRGEFDGLVLPGNGYTRTFELHPARQRLAAAALLLALAALARRGWQGGRVAGTTRRRDGETGVPADAHATTVPLVDDVGGLDRKTGDEGVSSIDDTSRAIYDATILDSPRSASRRRRSIRPVVSGGPGAPDRDRPLPTAQELLLRRPLQREGCAWTPFDSIGSPERLALRARGAPRSLLC
jgi:hypothetical protein